MIRHKPTKLESCKMTLEQRISRLERAFSSDHRLCKNESVADFSNMINARKQEGRRAIDIDGEEVTIVKVGTFDKLYNSRNSWEQYENHREIDDYAEDIRFDKKAWFSPAAIIRYNDGAQLLCTDPGEYLELI